MKAFDQENSGLYMLKRLCRIPIFFKCTDHCSLICIVFSVSFIHVCEVSWTDKKTISHILAQCGCYKILLYHSGSCTVSVMNSNSSNFPLQKTLELHFLSYIIFIVHIWKYNFSLTCGSLLNPSLVFDYIWALAHL